MFDMCGILNRRGAYVLPSSDRLLNRLAAPLATLRIQAKGLLNGSDSQTIFSHRTAVAFDILRSLGRTQPERTRSLANPLKGRWRCKSAARLILRLETTRRDAQACVMRLANLGTTDRRGIRAASLTSDAVGLGGNSARSLPPSEASSRRQRILVLRKTRDYHFS